jgi:hypothetical protein
MRVAWAGEPGDVDPAGAQPRCRRGVVKHGTRPSLRLINPAESCKAMRKIVVVAALLTLGTVAGIAAFTYPVTPTAYACGGDDHP